MQQKLKIGWFSFTCCEDSLIVFTELLNEHFFDWKEKFEFEHFRILKSNNKMTKLDIAFVEGAISSVKQEEELINIRKNSKKLVAVGSCAVTGRPSGARNDFSDLTRKKFDRIYKTFQYSKNVKRVDQVVKVDDSISGCPMNGEEFVERLDSFLGSGSGT